MKKPVRLPGNTANIHQEAFVAANATCISVPANVQTIGARAFTDNTALKLVRFDGNDTSIDETAFTGCGAFIFLCIQNSAPMHMHSSIISAAYSFPDPLQPLSF